MADPSPSLKAVFLSYAREDSVIAQRIADALRGFAIEVWFDQSELRGGDSWDQKIRKQIKDCSLFVPIISQATQSRGEGYFRLEWKLAVERTHLMAEGYPFLVPVAVGGLPESGALVPPEFLRVQWTRFAHDVPTPAFIDQIYRLLNSPRSGSSAVPTSSAPAGAGALASAPPAKKSRNWAAGALIAVAIASAVVIAIFVKRTPPAATPAAVAAPAAAPASDKSIAVLPFTNMSEAKDSVFFTDGVQEDILTDLALIHELRVVSRTSVEQYRGTTKQIPEIGKELGVSYILEGSVQREGNKVRVTGQLIRAATDEHVWAQAYDRDLTDIFSIQSELAQAIANALEAQITHRESDLLERRPTANVAAYELLLKAREENDLSTRGATDERIQLLRSAVDLDPSFSEAWGELADAYALEHFDYFERSDMLTPAKDAIEHAVKLAPDDPAIVADLGTYYYYGFRDYEKAAEQYQRLARLAPNDPTLFNSLALIQRRQGHWHESIANSRKAMALDPGNRQFLVNLYGSLVAVGDFEEALAVERRRVQLRPDLLARISLLEDVHGCTGSTAEGDALVAGLSSGPEASPQDRFIRERWALETGNVQEYIRINRATPYLEVFGEPHFVEDLRAVTAYAIAGDTAALQERAAAGEKEVRALLAESPDNVERLLILGQFEAVLRHREEARRLFDRALALLPISRDAVQGPVDAATAAACWAWTGDVAGALDQLERLQNTPNALTAIGATPAGLENVFFYPFRNNPRAKALFEHTLHTKL